MLKAPLKLADARVLLTNDDGIDAPGLAALEDALRGKVRQLVTVAPERNQSGCGHTVAVAHPIRLRQLSEHRFAVDSTPPDCVIMGVREVMQGVAPDLVISGINKGHNIGEYVHYSGTCAACYEAGLMRLPSIALSQQMAASGPDDFDCAQGWVAQLVERYISQPWPGDCFININFPARPSVQVTDVALSRLGRVLQGTGYIKGKDPRGRDYFWNDWCDDILQAVDAAADTDIGALARGAIAVTPVAIDQTDRAALLAMQATLKVPA